MKSWEMACRTVMTANTAVRASVTRDLTLIRFPTRFEIVSFFIVRSGREPLVYDVCTVVLCSGRAPAALPDGQLRGYAELVPEASAGAGSQPAGAPGYHYLQFRTHGDCGERSRRDHHCHRGQYWCLQVMNTGSIFSPWPAWP
mgnify:CR=1 FL=1